MPWAGGWSWHGQMSPHLVALHFWLVQAVPEPCALEGLPLSLTTFKELHSAEVGVSFRAQRQYSYSFIQDMFTEPIYVPGTSQPLGVNGSQSQKWFFVPQELTGGQGRELMW